MTNTNNEKFKIACIWIAVTIISSLPLLFPGMEGRFGQDFGFHIMRIEGLATELRNGTFPVKMQSLWMNGYGYPVSVYYGDFLLYFPAILRLLGCSVMFSYKMYVFMINFGTVVLSWFSFKKIFNNEYISLICTIAYVTAAYRYLNIYIRAAAGEYSAMMFLPVVAAAVHIIYTGKETDKKTMLRNSTMLALGMSGLIGTHLLTVEMTALILAGIAIILWKKTFTKKIIITLLVAVLEAIIVNLYFLVPFLDYYANVDVYINKVIGNARQIQKTGADFLQYISFFANPFQHGDESTRLGFTPGVILMTGMVVAILMFVRKKTNKETKLYLFMSLVMLIVSTSHFPWDMIGRMGKIGDLLAQVQFPWRYLGPACLFMTLLIGSILVRVKQKKILKCTFIGVLLVSVFMSGYFDWQYGTLSERVYYSDTDDLDKFYMGFVEYLRRGTQRDEFQYEITCDSTGSAQLIEQRGTTTEISCDAGDEDCHIEVPMLNYKGYHAVDENGTEYEIYDGVNNVIEFTVPKAFHGRIKIYFQEPYYWRIAELISLLSIIGIVLVEIKWKKRTNR